jgi:hypothetical protein
MQANMKDVGAGAVFAVVGLFYGSVSLKTLPIGQALNMGPGYFPIVLSSALVLLGLAIAGRGFVDTLGREPFGAVPWRGVIMLPLAALVFAAFVEKLGMLPGVFVTSFLASLANPKVRIVPAILASIGIAVFCTAVFFYGVRLAIPAIGPWLTW